MDKAELLKQKKIWYAKLKKSGFEDIESGNLERDGDQYLKPTPYDNILSNSKDKQFYGDTLDEQKKAYFEQKSNYYRFAGQFLHSHEFSSKAKEFVWQQHAEGMTQREISSVIKRRFKSRLHSLQYVNDTIQRLAKIMMGRDSE